MSINTHVVSNLILSLSGIFTFYKYSHLHPVTNRILWGVFLLGISLNALIQLLAEIKAGIPDNFQDITIACEQTLGGVCLVSASWCMIMRYKAEALLLIATISLGLFLFYCTTWLQLPFLGLIIQPLCLIITLLICCLGLGNKQKSALWVIFSMMLLALSTKSQRIPLPLDPIDINRYMMVLAVICFGNATRDKHEMLF